jgi:mannose-1-phosphate guanylyltransferase
MVNEQKLLGSMRELLDTIDYKLLGMSVRNNVVRLHMAYEEQAQALAQALRRGNFEEVTLRPHGGYGYIVTGDYVNKEQVSEWNQNG